MSRIGKKPIFIPDNCNIKIEPPTIHIKGPLGELTFNIPEKIKVEIQAPQLIVTRENDSKQTKAFHGLTRAYINNMILGVTQGFQKTLELIWTGSKVKMEKDKLVMDINYNHFELTPPQNTKIELLKGNKIKVSGIDKQKVGEIAARIRSFMKPSHYKDGKGIRYEGERVKIKPGKTGV